MRCWGRNVFGQVMLVGACLLEGCGVCLGEAHIFLTPCLLEQLGDNSTSHKLTPVDVSGLTSGVVSVALGSVRLSCLIRDVVCSVVLIA